MLNHGARVDSRNEDENTPLHLAAKNGKIRYAQIKVSWEVDFNKKMEKTFFAAQIEKTEINILQKMGKKAFLLKMEAKNFL